jgi:hypothetical protein
MSYPQPNDQAAGGQATSRPALRYLSPSLVVLAAAAFAGGAAAGYIAYLDRSPVLHKAIPGASAWPQQLVVAALACAAFGFAYWRHHRTPGRHGEPPWLLSPLGQRAARRLAQTVGSGLSGLSAFGRAVLALALAGLFLYGLYRAGEQVTAGLDPNFTVNAWGGPTYLGAMACHYLDLLVLMGATAWMLHLILLPDPANEATGSAARRHASPGAEELPRVGGFPVSDGRL